VAEEATELRQVIGLLSSAVGDLKIAVAELKITYASAIDRDREDRLKLDRHEDRISALERWRSLVTGQLALIAFIAGGTAVALGAAIFRRLIP
jgi:hypothetical protein